MASNYFQLVSLLILFGFLNFATTKAQDPTYLSEKCSGDKIAANGTLQTDLKNLFASLSSNATANTEFYNTTVTGSNSSDTVYGLFMCRGDFPSCGRCVLDATQRLSSSDSDCSLSKEAVTWYAECMVRYSNLFFFSIVATSPWFSNLNTANIANREGLMQLLLKTIRETADEAARPPTLAKKYATKEANVSAFQSLYCLAQCTEDLSPQDCRNCLSYAIGALPSCCGGKQGGRVVYPSCNVRYELYPFYGSTASEPLPSPAGLVPSPPGLVLATNSSDSDSRGKRKIRSQMILVMLVVTAMVSVMLLGLGAYFLRRRSRRSVKVTLKENWDATTTLGSLQFNLATIEAATNKFSPENKIGKGGFGEVYKGILPCGQEIAVKRLSNRSSQGFIEFKNEILLIAKLQHRNLVTLLGFHLDEREKILVYEYVPNKSLDYFLFGPQKEKQLSWFERYQIIRGIARAILYLHEHSRLKVIHCDLKPDNILLDNNMNPKISDFGMAKTIAIDEIHGRTSRIVGTRGYMSPKYAKLGKFSEKSDIFSFGVIILEIITGKRNTSNELQCVDGLLNYVWKQWSGKTPLQILDSNIKDSYCEEEVTKCIQIGLLCVQEDSNARPPMSTVISYIGSFSAKLPSPQEPAFYIHAKKKTTIVGEESRPPMVQAAANNSMSCSTNNMTASCLFPR